MLKYFERMKSQVFMLKMYHLYWREEKVYTF